MPAEIPAFELLEVLSQGFLMQEGVSGVSVTWGSAPRVRVYVEHESYEPFVPREIGGYPVEVVVTGRFYTLSSLPTRSRLRPIPGGVSIGIPDGPTGTLACRVYDARTGRRLMLSNRHVMEGGPGTPVIQPGRHDGGRYPEDVVGYVLRYAEVRPPPFVNRVDAALAAPVDESVLSDEILGIGAVSGAEPPREGAVVVKVGRTTGYTEGTVVDTRASVKVFGYPFGYAILSDQVVVMPSIAEPGDSGSLVVDKETGRAVGLLFAGSERATAVNRMDLVLSILGVSLVPGARAEVARGVDYGSVALGLVPVAVVGTVVGLGELAKRARR